MPPTQNPTLRIPPAAHLGEIAYRQYCFQTLPPPGGQWPEWRELADDDRQPWIFVGRVVARSIVDANTPKVV